MRKIEIKGEKCEKLRHAPHGFGVVFCSEQSLLPLPGFHAVLFFVGFAREKHRFNKWCKATSDGIVNK